jgi:CRISPR-associated endonuclease/helicase Cas3
MLGKNQYAHSPNSNGQWHNLADHLENAGRLAGGFAEKIRAKELGYWAGFWHDLGKFHPHFQAYLRNSEDKRGPDHSSAGAVFGARSWDGMAFLLAGHHGGLPDLTGLKQRLNEKQNHSAVKEAFRIAEANLSRISPNTPLASSLPTHVTKPTSLELFLRMLFSTLVDADFLDTEAHFNPERAGQRGRKSDLSLLWRRFEENQRAISGHKTDPINQMRHEIFEECVNSAELPPGIFRLTVPTGGGKTRSGMAFALCHAMNYKLDRIIVAIPYTSIIEQTADIYRDILGAEAVLEHHSAVVPEENPDSPTPLEVWTRLASENWDAPIIVTTTVQLFESLFGNRTTRCRKLHNISRSVLILDEVQTLPPGLLAPILDVLQDLADHYDVSVVLCTATQPALTDGPYLKGLRNVRDIIREPDRYFAVLKRVRYEVPKQSEQWPWRRVSEEMHSIPQCLTVVNTKKDALTLLDALNDPDALHLSTLLCGEHRRNILSTVQQRLKTGANCRLVSTQVVEAGVDLDFPVVLRAMGPLDRIVQAAGRCNREGRLKEGRVVIFNPAQGGIPRGAYRTATYETLSQLAREGSDLHDPSLYERYFSALYQTVETDVHSLQGRQGQKGLREQLDFPAVATKFRMIENATVPVVVHYNERATHLINKISGMENLPRNLLRLLQPFLVNVYENQMARLNPEGLLRELVPGLWEWLGQYDKTKGIVESRGDPEELVV